jgi:phospholipid/cholesterol/gamma-HCH transport system substrate-binding protein
MNPLITLRNRLGRDATRVAVISAFVLVVLMVAYITSQSKGGTYEMKAVFDDVRGLIPGGEVRAGAIPVGEVTAVELNSEDEPEATFRVSDDFPLHEGAVADIRLGSNVGAVNRTIELTQGDPTKPVLAEGSTLSGTSTDQPVNFDDAVQALNPPTRKNVGKLLAGLDAAVKGRGKDFDRALRYSSVATNESANLFAQVGADGAALSAVVRETERVVSALASSPGDLAESADRTALLLETTGNRQADLAESMQRIGPALAGGRTALERLAKATPNLRELVAGLEPVVDELGPLVRILPEATAKGGPFLVETRKLVESGPRDLANALPVIEAANAVTPKLDTVARGALGLGQELRVYAPETIGAFQNFGAATGSYDRVGHILTTIAGDAQFGPPHTNPITESECGPGLVELPFIRAPGTLECEPWTDFRDSFIFPKDEQP